MTSTRLMMEDTVDIAQTLDATLKLYAMPFTRLLSDNPDVQGVNALIGRAQPSMLAQTEDGHGYHHDAIEAAARGILDPLAERTMETQRACAVGRHIGEPLGIRAWRGDRGLFVEASLSDRLGGVFAKQKALTARGGLAMAFFEPPVLYMTLDCGTAGGDIAERVKRAARAGLDQAVALIVENSVLLNGRWTERPSLWDWASAFPERGTTRFLEVHAPRFLTLATPSCDAPVLKLVVTREDIESGGPELAARLRDAGLRFDVFEAEAAAPESALPAAGP